MNKNVLQRIASLQLQGKNDHDKDFLAIAANDAEILKKWSAPLSNEERANRNNAIFDHWLAGESENTISKKALIANIYNRMGIPCFIVRHTADCKAFCVSRSTSTGDETEAIVMNEAKYIAWILNLGAEMREPVLGERRVIND